jgi:hypothetical protein
VLNYSKIEYFYLDKLKNICYSSIRGKIMYVDENTEYYLIHSMGLTKTQIKKMLPSEIEEHCKKAIRKEIDDTGIYKPNDKK